MKRLENKVAIVTGGAGGLGKAISVRLAEEGAIINVFDMAEASDTLSDVEKAGSKGLGFIVDISKSEEVDEAIKQVLSKWGELDILVNNAGAVSSHENLLTVTDEIWDREISINLTGTFNCCRAAFAEMVKQQRGKIVNIASIAGETGRISTSPAYSAAKAGVYGLTMSMAKNGAKDGINVNAVCPGVILTGIHDNYPKEALDKLLSEIPYVRGGVPMDIANAVLFLSSSESDYINGAKIQVNGGSYMK